MSKEEKEPEDETEEEGIPFYSVQSIMNQDYKKALDGLQLLIEKGKIVIIPHELGAGTLLNILPSQLPEKLGLSTEEECMALYTILLETILVQIRKRPLSYVESWTEQQKKEASGLIENIKKHSLFKMLVYRCFRKVGVPIRTECYKRTVRVEDFNLEHYVLDIDRTDEHYRRNLVTFQLDHAELLELINKLQGLLDDEG